MSDVVRAAVSEIDDYQRIEIKGLEPAQLAGGVVADVAHLLAELFENAAKFSPPTAPVEVRSVFDIDGYQLIINDRGPGMTNEEIAELNEILRSPPALGVVMPTMGIYVVARLAARHGISVELAPAIPGLTVRVTVPRHLLEVESRRHPTYGRSGSHSGGEAMAARRLAADQVAAGKHVSDGDVYAPDMDANRVPVSSDAVIDLTDSDPDEVGDADSAPSAHRAGADPETSKLAVRPPSRAFSGESDMSRSVVEAESAVDIKTALSAFDRGRRAADSARSGEEETDPTTRGDMA